MKVFLLSPASTGGKRAQLLFNERAQFPVAAALRAGGTTLGEVFSFLSGLYFRGKLGYARAFAGAATGLDSVLVITPDRGLVSPETRVTLEDLRAFARSPIDVRNPAYCEPLLRDAQALARTAGPRLDVVLLGSIASAKYVDVLLPIFGDHLLFPEQFVGRGDMSRGGLMLRCTDTQEELAYVAVSGAIRHGKRPPRLGKR